MYRKAVIFPGGGKHCEGTAWKAGVRWSFLNTAEREEELAEHGGANWEGQADQTETGHCSVYAPLYCIRDHIASCGQTALGS